MKTVKNVLEARALMIAFAILFAGSAANAHVSLEKSEAKVGTGYKAVFKVPHGCEGASTTEIQIDIPEGVIAVKPMPKPGWTISLDRDSYARSYGFYHGTQLAEGVRRVTWRGGPLPDAHFDEFIVSGFIARELEPGTVLVFPVTQRCDKGELAWKEVPAPGQNPHDLDFPAPQLKLIAAADNHAGHGTHAIRAGGLAIEVPWTRAAAKGAAATAGYLKITNKGAKAEKLLEASTEAAERVELHETTVGDDGVAKMRAVTGSVTIAPGETIAFEPLGRHLMLSGLKGAITAGETISIRLTFESAGGVEVPFDVKPVGVKGHQDHKH
jgi:periplasmic copper chaperone A